MSQVTGTLIIQADGLSIQSKEGQASLEYGGKERQAVYSDGVLLGPAEKTIAATVSATLAHTSTTSMDALRDAKNITLTVITDTGKRYVVRNAFSTKPPKLSGEAGDVEIEYMGQPAQAQ